MKLVELAFFTDKVSEMAAFYQRLLGMEAVAQSEDMAIFMVGHTKIFIHKNYTPKEGELPPDNHIAFEVEDLDAACAELVDRGLTLEVPSKDYYWGRSAYLRAPDGQMVEVCQGDGGR
jgi:catechol 2,3-dioxygenase-like lactoylglutathione lyase family enzyme